MHDRQGFLKVGDAATHFSSTFSSFWFLTAKVQNLHFLLLLFTVFVIKFGVLLMSLLIYLHTFSLTPSPPLPPAAKQIAFRKSGNTYSTHLFGSLLWKILISLRSKMPHKIVSWNM